MKGTDEIQIPFPTNFFNYSMISSLVNYLSIKKDNISPSL